MGFQLLLFALGLAGLYLGAEWMVRGAARLARSLGISALVVGLTVVAFGTSAPELIVTTVAALRGQPGVAVGNVIGSNIANVGLILGIAGLISPLRAEMRLLRQEVPVMVASSLLLVLLALDFEFSRLDGLLCLLGFVGYIVLVLRTARDEPATVEARYHQFETAGTLEPSGESRTWDIVLLVSGLAALAAGANLLVAAAVFIARELGVPDVTIGLTVVAIGTSLPELATSVVAAVRREADIALGNIIGSNIFNVLAILGVASVTRPLAVDPTLFRFELPVMVGLGLVLPVFIWTRLTLARLEGGILLASYIAFTWVLLGRTG